MSHLSQRIKKVRDSLALDQKQIAEKLGISHRSWQDYETGKSYPGGKVFEALVTAGVSADWLLTGEGSMNKEPLVAEEEKKIQNGIDPATPHWQSAVLAQLNEVINEEVRRRQKINILEPKDQRLRDIKWWLDDFWKNADEDMRSWMIVEMKTKFPQFSEWLEERKKVHNSLTLDEAKNTNDGCNW